MIGIGSALGMLVGMFGWGRVQRGRNGNGDGLSPSSKAIVAAIEGTETSNQRRHIETKELNLVRHDAMMTKMGEVATIVNDVQKRQGEAIAHREGVDEGLRRAKREG